MFEKKNEFWAVDDILHWQKKFGRKEKLWVPKRSKELTVLQMNKI